MSQARALEKGGVSRVERVTAPKGDRGVVVGGGWRKGALGGEKLTG